MRGAEWEGLDVLCEVGTSGRHSWALCFCDLKFLSVHCMAETELGDTVAERQEEPVPAAPVSLEELTDEGRAPSSHTCW